MIRISRFKIIKDDTWYHNSYHPRCWTNPNITELQSSPQPEPSEIAAPAALHLRRHPTVLSRDPTGERSRSSIDSKSRIPHKIHPLRKHGLGGNFHRIGTIQLGCLILGWWDRIYITNKLAYNLIQLALEDLTITFLVHIYDFVKTVRLIGNIRWCNYSIHRV